MKTSRRQFLKGCSTAVAALAGARIRHLGWAADGAAGENRETLVVVFLRGGMDGLSFMPPVAGDDRGYYEAARPNLKIPSSGTGAALSLTDQFGLHPSAAGLRTLYQGGKLAIVQAVGSSGSRSHFDAQRYLELGTPGIKTTAEGWLTRHLGSSPALPGTIVMPALAAGNTPPTSLQGSHEVVNLVEPTTFNLSSIGDPSWAAGEQWSVLRRLLGLERTFLHAAGLEALNAAGLVESYLQSNYVPSGGAVYAADEFGPLMKLVAQLVKTDAGLRVATVDLGGWDTHDHQGNQTGGLFSNLVKKLSDGLAAFYADLDGSTADAPIKRVTVVVLSEFGRRLRENANLGTDHGTGNPVFVLGGNVRGGLYGTWPGLASDQLFDSADLAPTTDLRQVLSEVLIRRTGNPKLGEVFPRYSGYAPLNVVSGPDLTPDYTVALPVTPVDFTARRADATVVRLTWSAAVHASNYRIERRSDTAASWEHVAIVGADTLRHDDTNAPAGGNPVYRLQAFNSHGEGAFVEAAIIEGSDPMGQWRFKYFGTVANSGAAANDAVATDDGLPNYVKYALGLDPRVPALAPTTGYAPGRPRIEVNGTSVSLVFVRPVERTDVVYEVVTSVDLRTWSLVAQVSEGVQDAYERLRATVAGPDPGHQFLRLTVRPA